LETLKSEDAATSFLGRDGLIAIIRANRGSLGFIVVNEAAGSDNMVPLPVYLRSLEPSSFVVASVRSSLNPRTPIHVMDSVARVVEAMALVLGRKREHTLQWVTEAAGVAWVGEALQGIVRRVRNRPTSESVMFGDNIYSECGEGDESNEKRKAIVEMITSVEAALRAV
jgi:hypothetical protein